MNEEDVVLVVGMAIIVAMELLKRLRLVGSARALVKQAMVAGMAALGVMMAHNWVPYEGMWRDVAAAALTAMVTHKVVVQPNKQPRGESSRKCG